MKIPQVKHVLYELQEEKVQLFVFMSGGMVTLAKGSPKAQTLKGAIIYALFSRIITIDFRNGPVHT